MHKTFVIDWLTYVKNIMQLSLLFPIGPFDVVGPRNLPTMPMPQSGPINVVYHKYVQLMIKINVN